MTDLRNLTEDEHRRVVENIRAARGASLDILRQSFADAGIAPSGWSGLSAEGKRRWLEENLPAPVATPARKAATMPKDPKWKRRQHKAYAIPYIAAGPLPKTDPLAEPGLSRQRRRSLERRAAKQPLGMKQRVWHELSGFAKAKPRTGAGV